MKIEIGIEWNTLELWMTITDIDGDYDDGYTPTDGTIELDDGDHPNKLELFVGAIIKERHAYIWDCVVRDCADRISEEIAEDRHKWAIDQAEYYCYGENRLRY